MSIGFELEVVAENGHKMIYEAFKARFPFVIMQGFQIGCNSMDQSGVKVCYDTSIKQAYDRCVEIKSPVFRDAESAVRGFEVISGVCRDHGARTNVHCGLHIHVGLPWLARDDYWTALALVKEWWLPHQWRFLNLAYPRGVIGRGTSRLIYAAPWSREDIEYAVKLGPEYVEKEERRYRALNILSLRKHGTLEFRLFPSTLDSELFARWLGAVIDWCDRAPPDLSASIAEMHEHHARAVAEFQAVWKRVMDKFNEVVNAPDNRQAR